MPSPNKLWLGFLAVILYAPLRSTCSINFSVPNPTAPNVTVYWTRNDTDPAIWEASASWNSSTLSTNEIFNVLNSNSSQGNFSLFAPLPGNLTLHIQGFEFPNGMRMPKAISNPTTFEIPAVISPTPQATIEPGSGPSSASVVSLPSSSSSSALTSSPIASSSRTDTIIGAVVGSVAFLLIAGILLFLCLRNRRRRLERTDPPEFTRDKMVREPYTGFPPTHQSTTRDRLSTRSSLYSDDSARPLKSELVDAWAI
ncbi:hypothetical protein BT96DRAFT_1018557 [Gymnopus androsaceus JB14]|uniref:Mid2 domain-containing protein n=1 Tax=Gymnopus androsaceus JB14 TaxID=1447944 RepID=A0A6A4HSJ8_9AGAR|nr:hypothetical protein BT96DRAFT_1018557 [Gymnopus androsaceus JB14]